MTSPRKVFFGFPAERSVQAPVYGHGRKGREGINGKGRVGRDYIVKFPRPMHFSLRRVQERSLTHIALDDESEEGVFWFSR